MRTMRYSPRAFRPLAFAFLGLLLGLAVAAGASGGTAEAAPKAVKSTASFPLSGTVFHRGTGEDVLISGTVSVSARFHPTDPVRCRIDAKLTDTSATGESSGARYKAFGKARFFPTDPVRCRDDTITERGIFKLKAHPGDPIIPGESRTVEFPVDVTMTFDQDGKLTGGEAEIAVT